MREYKVKVTSNHIKRGKKSSDTCNPVALAIMEETGLPGWIINYGRAVRFNSGDYAVLPGIVEKWLIHFNGGDKVNPTEFTLRVY